MKRTIIFVIPLLLMATVIMGQEFSVDYVDGYLDVQEGRQWYELYIGDAVDATDTVRLGADSYAELSDGVTTIKLTRAGTYRLGDLSTSARRTQSSGIGGMVLGRVGRLTGQATQQQQTTQGGVRASEAVNQNQPTWAGGESVDDLIKSGLGLLNDGELQDAYWVFQEAYDYALDDDEYAMSLFYYGYGSALIGNTSDAFDLLEEVGPDPDTDYYEDHVIVLGQLLLESFAYEDALDYLALLTEDPGAEEGAKQSALLLAGLAYDGMGNVTLARRYLERSRDVLPGNESAQLADDLLDQL